MGWYHYGMRDWHVVSRFGRYLIPYWKQEVLVLCLLIIGTVTTLAPPYLMKVIIDDVFPYREYARLFPVLAALLATAAVGALAMFGVDYLYSWISNRVMQDIRHDFFAHLLRLPQRFYHEQKAGDIIFRINNDVNQIQFILAGSMLRLVHSVLVLVGVSAILCWLNYQLFLVAVLAIPVFAVNIQWYQSRIRLVTEEGQRKHAQIMDFFKVCFENVKLIQCFNGHEHERTRLRQHINQLIAINMRGAVYAASMRAISTGLVSLMPLLVFGWGGYKVMSGAMTLGTVVAFLSYLLRVFDPIQSLNGLYLDLVRAGVSMKRVMDFADVPNELQSHTERRPLPEHPTRIAFDSVVFGYNGVPVLNKLSLEFRRGRSYGLCGRSGCGKSTLVNLLLRLDAPQEGRILLDDVDLQSVDVDKLRASVALVPQETLLFQDTVLANLCYGSWVPKDSDITRVMDTSGLSESLTQQSADMNTSIGDRGMQLSGGQKQRLAIARALMKEAELLVLDEATSALDAESERRVLESIRASYTDKTLIVVSHRPGVLQMVDEVICLADGRVAERGTHTELTARNGFYQSMLQDRSQEKADRT